MINPAWYDDILAVYPAFLARLREIPQVKKVLEAKDLQAITGETPTQTPLNGAVYVVLDGFNPTETAAGGREQTIEIGFSVILTMTSFTPKPNNDSVGAILTAICKAMQGFDPTDEQGRALVTKPFIQKTAIPIQYEQSFAYFPLRFTAEVAVIAEQN